MYCAGGSSSRNSGTAATVVGEEARHEPLQGHLHRKADGADGGEGRGEGSRCTACAGAPANHQPDGRPKAEREEGGKRSRCGGKAAEENGTKQTRPSWRTTQAEVGVTKHDGNC